LDRRRAHACGFNGCVSLSDTWKEHFDHICNHMKNGDKDWSCTTKILNLLRHPDIERTWEHVKLQYRDQGFNTSVLSWDPRRVRHLVRQLESMNFKPDRSRPASLYFEPDLISLLGRLLYLGCLPVTSSLEAGPRLAALNALQDVSYQSPSANKFHLPSTLPTIGSVNPHSNMTWPYRHFNGLGNIDTISQGDPYPIRSQNRDSIVMADSPNQDAFSSNPTSWPPDLFSDIPQPPYESAPKAPPGGLRLKP
jgi:hypothetical protein